MIGINPSGAPDLPGRSMSRFRDWCNFLGLKYVSFTNLHWDENWNKKISTVDTSFLLSSIGDTDKVIALGSLPSTVLTRMGVEHFRMPHPSPLNRLINDRSYIDQKLQECREYIYA